MAPRSTPAPLRSLAALVPAALLAALAPAAARAESEAVCRNYAAEAVAAQRQNLRRNACKLTGPMWSENYGGHFDWCRGQPPQVVAAEAKKRMDALTECTTRPQYCQRYANAAVVAQNANLANRACNKQGPRWSNVYINHYNWCLGQPRHVSQREHEAREAELRACSFAGAPKSPGQFAGALVTGVELVRDGPGGGTVPVIGNANFLSQGSVCGAWAANRARVNAMVEGHARGKGAKGFNVRSDARSDVTGTCTARAEAAGGGIRLDVRLPNNVFYFHLTTPGPIGGWADPRFSITYDVTASIFIRVPSTGGQPFVVQATAVVSNLRPNSHNVTGDAALAVAAVIDLFTGGIIRRQIPAELPFQQTVERDLGPIARAVPAGARLDQYMAPGRPIFIIHATTRPPSGPIVR